MTVIKMLISQVFQGFPKITNVHEQSYQSFKTKTSLWSICQPGRACMAKVYHIQLVHT